MPLAGRPLLERMLERVRVASTPSEIVVATTVEEADDPIRELCGRLGVRCFSGDPLDLLDRHYRAALECGADVAVKIPSDCPLIDPEVIDRVIGEYLRGDGAYDFVSNVHPQTWPDGQDVEAIGMETLEIAWREADRPFEREHTTPFIWERPERFAIGNVLWDSGRDLSMTHRWTIDYPEDYRFLSEVYDSLASDTAPPFTVDDILALIDERPEIAAINAEHVGINWYRHHRDELRTV
jgi:spore coat polysaccharide biosynthesis protein SpsF